MRNLTEKEIDVLRSTCDLAHKYNQMPIVCNDDARDFYFHLRAIQSIIHARPSVDVEFLESTKIDL